MCRKEAEGRKAQGIEETLKEGMETELMEWYPGCKEIKKVRVCSIQVKDVQTGTVKDEHRRERLERGIHWARLCLKPVFSYKKYFFKQMENTCHSDGSRHVYKGKNWKCQSDKKT